MKVLELKEFLLHTKQNCNSFAMSLRIMPPKMHTWKHRGNCMVSFDEDFKVHKITLLMADKVVFEV
jgi:hypothetical protein|tara:strand:+ start:1625 stop:1822 length:198 start_codon:yes stop_codon:yes gene_type:complete